jgi:hypothetical protein
MCVIAARVLEYTAEESDLLRLVQRRGDISRLGARVLQRQRQIQGEVASDCLSHDTYCVSPTARTGVAKLGA